MYKFLYLIYFGCILLSPQAICSDLNELKTTSKSRSICTFKQGRELYCKTANRFLSGEINSEQTVELFIKSNYPQGLFDAGKSYQDGIVGKIDGRPNMKKAAELYYQAKTDNAFCNLAYLYQNGHYGLKDDGTPNYEEAARLNRLSNVPLAKYNLGYMYHQGHIGIKDGKCDFKTAENLYLQSKLSQAYCNLGNLHRDGHLGNKPNYQKAEENYLKSTHPNAYWNRGRLYSHGHLKLGDGKCPFEFAADCYRQAGHPEALCDLACLYVRGQVGLIDGNPDLEKARILYLESKLPEAYLNLGILYYRGDLDPIDGKPDYKTAFKYLSQSKTVIAKGLRLFIIEAKYDSISSDYPNFSQGLLTNLACRELEIYLRTAMPEDREFILGLLSEYKDKNAQQALIHLNQALVLGAQGIEPHIAKLQMLLKLEEEIADEKIETKEEVTASASIEFTAESEPLPDIKTEEGKPKKYKPIKPEVSREERLKKIFEKVRQKHLQSLKAVEVKEKDEDTAITPLVFKFIDDEIKNDFEQQPQKLQEFLTDMEEKPYGTDGAGKPEVLKGIFKGYKGCISRRIDQENRFVYKVMGPREVMILSCKGHYTK
jgi:Txe/YoeB family toxin of toxin-antitoxin system